MKKKKARKTKHGDFKERKKGSHLQVKALVVDETTQTISSKIGS